LKAVIAQILAVPGSWSGHMAEGGTRTFGDSESYAAGFGDVRINLSTTGAGDFKARLIRLKLKHLEVCRCYESLPRIAYISLPPGQVFLSFSIREISPIFNGFALRNGDVILHSRGERFHQQTNDACKWGLISVSPEKFASLSRALTGREIVLPPAARILRPSRADALRLQRLLKQTCALEDGKRKLLERAEVRRALEQEMLELCGKVGDDGLR
jgi:hypothetical protein